MEEHILLNKEIDKYFSSMEFIDGNKIGLKYTGSKKYAWRFDSMSDVTLFKKDTTGNIMCDKLVSEELLGLVAITSPWYETIVDDIITLIYKTHNVMYVFKRSNIDNFWGFYHPFHSKFRIEFDKDYVSYGSNMLLPHRVGKMIDSLRVSLFNVNTLEETLALHQEEAEEFKQ